MLNSSQDWRWKSFEQWYGQIQFVLLNRWCLSDQGRKNISVAIGFKRSNWHSDQVLSNFCYFLNFVRYCIMCKVSLNVLINLICIFFSASVTLLKYMAASLALMKAFSKRLYGEIFIFTPNQSVSLKEHRPKLRSHYLCSLCWRTCGLCMMLYWGG